MSTSTVERVERGSLKARARENVREDIAQLQALAQSRAVNERLGQRTRYLAACEYGFLTKLLTRLETLP